MRFGVSQSAHVAATFRRSVRVASTAEQGFDAKVLPPMEFGLRHGCLVRLRHTDIGRSASVHGVRVTQKGGCHGFVARGTLLTLRFLLQTVRLVL